MEINDLVKVRIPNSKYSFGRLAGKIIYGKITKINKKSYEVRAFYKKHSICLLIDKKEYKQSEIAKGR